MDLNPLYPLTYEEAQELAASFLTSSTIERYLTCLKSSKAVRRLMSQLKFARSDGKELLQYGWFYRARLIESAARSEWELPASVILYAVGHSGIANAERLLEAFLLPNSPQLAWLGGLSRRLLALRSGSQIEAGLNTDRLISLGGMGTKTLSSTALPAEKPTAHSILARRHILGLLEVA